MLTVERAVVSHKVTPSNPPGRSGRCSGVRCVCPGAAHPRAALRHLKSPDCRNNSTIVSRETLCQVEQRATSSFRSSGRRVLRQSTPKTGTPSEPLDSNDAMRHTTSAAVGLRRAVIRSAPINHHAPLRIGDHFVTTCNFP